MYEYVNGKARLKNGATAAQTYAAPVVPIDLGTEGRELGAYESLGVEVGLLVQSKQAAYGDSFGRSGAVLAALYPAGVLPAQLSDALTIVRVVDKLFRVATDRDALGESPWRDIAGYALLALKRSDEERRQGSESRP